MNITTVSRLLSVGAALALVNGAYAGNLVQNGSFEDGTYSIEDVSSALPVDWTFTAATDGDNSDFFISTAFNATGAEDGNFFAAFGATGVTYDYISQVLPTVNGASYSVSFWLNNNDALSEGASQFNAFWDGTDIGPDITSQSAEFGWTEFSTTQVGTGSDSLTFGGLNIPAFIALDNVVVEDASAVPDQGVGLATLAVVLGGICVFSARVSRRQTA